MKYVATFYNKMIY